MKTKKSEKVSKLKKLLDQYRVAIIDEETFEEKFHFKASRVTASLSIILYSIFISTITYILIAFSPIKEFVPGYPSSKLRMTAISNSIRFDSIIDNFEKQKIYFNSIKKALSGDIDVTQIQSGTIQNFSATNAPFPEVSKEDSELRQFVAQEEKYNFNPSINSNLYILYPPAKGVVSQKFNPGDNHFAIDISLEENTPINSVAEGTVIFSEWTAQTGYVIIIEHPSGFISVYKHNSSITKNQGDSVESGEVIARAGNTGEFSTGFHLHFELWSEGYPLNPEDFIDFSR
ncbi:MAG: peptidase M23 [Flavobacteriales bacterium]|nr:peptidase M23 [Flavobacteriales bacterium]